MRNREEVTIENLFVSLYPFVTLISIVAFVPQVKVLLEATAPTWDISLGSWSLWLLNSVLSFGYGVCHLEDFLFSATMGISVFFNMLMIGMVLYNRHIRFNRTSSEHAAVHVCTDP